MLIVEVDYDEIIQRIRISGDFFAYPETCIDELEIALVGVERDANKVGERVTAFFNERDVVTYGIEVSDLIEAITRCLEDDDEIQIS